jgi:lipid A 4'-phosphatase
MFFGSAAVGACASLFFYSYPRFDLAVAEQLHISARHFVGSESVLFSTLRYGFTTLFCIVCGLTVLGCVISISTQKSWLSLSSRRWLYLAVCLLVGPLTIANLGFKDHWGRPRPTNVTEFGGSKSYEPPLTLSNQCEWNCSFVSGEASSIYIICFAAAFLFPDEAALWIIAGIILGSFAGFVRMTEGGHFLSDVLFAGVFMALTASAIDMLFAIVARDPTPTD